MTEQEADIWARFKQQHHSTAQIAKALNMEESTVDRILARLMDKQLRNGARDDNV